MLSILFITFYIKKDKIEIISNFLRKHSKLFLINDYKDFEKVRDIKFDFVLTAYYWKINWAGHFEKKKYTKEIPSFIQYKHLIFQDSNPLSSYQVDVKGAPGFFIYRFSIGSLEIPMQINKIDEIVKQKRKIYKFKIKPYKKPSPDLAILILLQNYFNHFLNMTIKEYQSYIQNIILEIRKYSKNKIIVRYKNIEKEDDHRKYQIKLKDPLDNMEITGKNSPDDDIAKSYVAIAHSTNAVFKVCLEGVHLISMSPFCLCHEFADHDISFVNNPSEFDRELLYYKLLSCTWSYEDFKNGNFIKYISSHLDEEKIS